jgi:hypothetical protein
MSTATTKATEKPPTKPAFTVEFGDDNCRNMVLKTLRLKVRGRWSLAILQSREIGGRDVGAAMSQMPEIPGLRLRVIPKELKIAIFDPLESKPELVERINRVFKAARGGASTTPYKAVERVEQDFSKDPDKFKTLICELARMKDAGTVKMHDGKFPTEAEIDKMPGRELYDPGGDARTCRYRDEFPEWSASLDRQSQ